MSTVFHYEVDCTGTGTQEIFTHLIWDKVPPTSCPTNNPDHTFIPNSISIIEEVTENTVTIKEEDIPTGGRLRVRGVRYDITAATGASQDFDITFPIDINLNSVFVPTDTKHTGDMYEVSVAPNTTIGILTATAATGTNEITVSQTVIDNIKKGYYVTLTDGVHTEQPGQVIAINKITNQLTLQTPLSQSLTATSPTTYVQQTIKLAETIYMGAPANLRFGDDKIGSAFIPANTTIRFTYYNYTGGQKMIVAYGTYLY